MLREALLPGSAGCPKEGATINERAYVLGFHLSSVTESESGANALSTSRRVLWCVYYHRRCNPSRACLRRPLSQVLSIPRGHIDHGMGEIDAQERSSVRSRNESQSDQVPSVLSPPIAFAQHSICTFSNSTAFDCDLCFPLTSNHFQLAGHSDDPSPCRAACAA